MATDNTKLELVVEVDTTKGNASIKGFNSTLSSSEQAAAQMGRGVSQSIDGMTVSMAKGVAAGNLLADSIKAALNFVKEWTVSAAQYAAHTDKMGLSMQALAKAHGVSVEAANRAVESIKKVGFETQDAVHAVDRFLVANMGLEKAQGLAKIAKDAAAIENISPGEALEKLMMAIESGASRGLRTMGIFVDLGKEVERQEKLTGKTLSESQVIELRRQAVEREAAKIHGAAAAAAGSAESQTKALAREVNELREAVGEKFQGYLQAVVAHLRSMVGFLKDNTDWLVKFGQGAMVAVAIIGTITAATKAWALAQGALNLAMSLNPVTLTVGAGLLGVAAIYKTGSDIRDDLHRRGEQMLNDGLRQQLATGKIHVDDLRKRGMKDEEIRDLIGKARPADDLTWDGPEFGGIPKLNIKTGGGSGLSDDEVDRIATERRKRSEAEKSAQELYTRAVEERKGAEMEQARERIQDSLRIIETTHSETAAAKEMMNVAMLSMQERQAGIDKIKEDEKREIDQRSSYVDDKSGAVRHFKLNQATMESIHQATAEKLAAFDMKFGEEESRRLETMMKASAARLSRMIDQLYFEPLKQQMYVWEQKQEWQDKIDDQVRGAKLAGVDQKKDLQLAALDGIDARTLRDKVALENAKTGIEVQAIKDRAKIEMEQLDAQTERQVAEARKAAMAKGVFYEPDLKEIEGKIRDLSKNEKDALQGAATNQVDVEQAKGASATRQLVVGEYQRIFNSLKQQAGGVFDALLSKSQSVWSAIGNSLKTAMLTAIKDVVTSRVAAALMNMFVPGSRPQFQGGGGSGSGMGILGALGIGAVPAFAGGGAGGGAGVPGGGGYGMSPVAALGGLGGGGSAGSFGSLASIVGGPGGTTGFAGPVGGGAGYGGAGNGGAGGIMNMVRGGWGSLKSLAGFGHVATDSNGTKWANINNHMVPLDSAGNIAMTAATSPIAMAAGGLLATSGLLGSQRGTWGGVAMGTAGGALLGAGIGMQFGGPAGALLGAGIGAAAGFGIGIGEKLFGVETPEREAKRLVKQLYQVNIDTAMAKQIVDLAKQKYSGHVSMAVRDPDIRKTIELYAAATGQHMPMSATTPHGASLIEQGSNLYQAPTYMFGNPNVYQSSLPTIGGPAGQYPGPMSLQLNVSGQGAAQFVAGQVVTPEFVQSQWSSAAASSNGRVSNSAWMQQPGLITG